MSLPSQEALWRALTSLVQFFAALRWSTPSERDAACLSRSGAGVGLQALDAASLLRRLTIELPINLLSAAAPSGRGAAGDSEGTRFAGEVFKGVDEGRLGSLLPTLEVVAEDLAERNATPLAAPLSLSAHNFLSRLTEAPASFAARAVQQNRFGFCRSGFFRRVSTPLAAAAHFHSKGDSRTALRCVWGLADKSSAASTCLPTCA